MPVVTHHQNDLYGPALLCHHCQQPIRDPAEAMAVYENSGKSDDVTRAFVTHKDDFCRLPILKTAGYVTDDCLQDELPEFLIRLAASFNITWGRLEEANEYCSQRGFGIGTRAERLNVTDDDHEPHQR